VTRSGLLVRLALAAALFLGAARGDAETTGDDGARLAALEERSRAFYTLLEGGQRAKAATVWPDLARDLEAFAEALETRLDEMRDAVMERDGDLEELYRSPRWREPEIASLVVAYHLAWVHYQGAQLTDDAKRRQALLQRSIKGFSRFLLVNEVPEIYAESLYGRGLAFLDLGQTGKAIEDLTAAAEDPRTRAKAGAALAEARRRAGGARPAREVGPEESLARLGELVARAAAGDAAAEREATTLARGLAAAGGDQAGRVATLAATALGEGKPASVRSSWGLFLLAQLAVDGGRCADVAPLAAASAALRDQGRSRHRPEILFFDAGCRLNGGRAREAADVFGVLLEEFPKAGRAREASYYRARALAVARTTEPTLTPAYEEALEGYLRAYPGADGADEMRWELAELHRGLGDCPRALPEYAAVGQGPFAARARLGGLECRAAAAAASDQDGPRRETIDALGAFVAGEPDRALAARAALLGAALAAGARPADQAVVVELLDGFESRYPERADLHRRALELRLTARVARGELEDAGRDLDAYLGTGSADADLLARVGGDLAGRAGRGSPPALALARTVYQTLVRERGAARDRVALAELELGAGDAAAARRLFEEALQTDAGSAEALRGAARAAAAAGDRGAALAYWRRVVDGSPPGGTVWYEARLAEVTLLAADGRRADACRLLRAARGRATTPGADRLEGQLSGLEAEICG
jgi:tetratricopeptide (TPR) repeat protein